MIDKLGVELTETGSDQQKSLSLLLLCCVPSNLANSQLCSRVLFQTTILAANFLLLMANASFFPGSIPTLVVVQTTNPSFSQYIFSPMCGSQPPALNFLVQPRSRATGKSEASGSKGNTERTAVFTSWRVLPDVTYWKHLAEQTRTTVCKTAGTTNT